MSTQMSLNSNVTQATPVEISSLTTGGRALEVYQDHTLERASCFLGTLSPSHPKQPMIIIYLVPM